MLLYWLARLDAYPREADPNPDSLHYTHIYSYNTGHGYPLGDTQPDKWSHFAAGRVYGYRDR